MYTLELVYPRHFKVLKPLNIRIPIINQLVELSKATANDNKKKVTKKTGKSAEEGPVKEEHTMENSSLTAHLSQPYTLFVLSPILNRNVTNPIQRYPLPTTLFASNAHISWKFIQNL